LRELVPVEEVRKKHDDEEGHGWAQQPPQEGQKEKQQENERRRAVVRAFDTLVEDGGTFVDGPELHCVEVHLAVSACGALLIDLHGIPVQ
jgi:hypothetical protein